jgi:hypothetical protein
LNLDVVPPVSSVDASLRETDATSRFILVPGGRFLFTINFKHRYVDLWDLGFAGQPPLPKPALISSLNTLPSNSAILDYVIFDAGEGRLRIGLTLDTRGDEMYARHFHFIQ